MEKLDGETGLYYYGSSYLDPKYSRWISTDMSVRGLPGAAINEEAKKHER